MSGYNFTLKATRTFIDPVAKYGYWERSDGSEGGGLWFETMDGPSQQLELIDYDGRGCLPKTIIAEIRALGVHVDTIHE